MTDRKASLNLGVIGNCSYSALIDEQARVVWSCLPHFDSDPVFCSLLSPTDENADLGMFEIVLEDLATTSQQYLPNSAVLVTKLTDKSGAELEITDFAPRFRLYDRLYRPMQMVRIVRPISGQPLIRVRLRPLYGFGAVRPETTRGSNHIRYVMPELNIRLTTNAPISYVSDETPFVLQGPVTLVLGPDESLEGSPNRTGQDFLERTLDYWREWVRYLSLPFDWQDAVIRSAITLKLSNFEETGAVIAAMTTSIPEAANSGRNWDYRLCWLRDSYFVVHTLNRLGATRTMEHYLHFITNLIAQVDTGRLQPVYGITTDAQLNEFQVNSLSGYRGMGPVRHGNQAFEQQQNDSYGAVILAMSQLFFDHRLHGRGDRALFNKLEGLGHSAARLFNEPDAGLWELRGRQRIHTFSSVMCWAATDRLARIAQRLGIQDRAKFWRHTATDLHAKICEAAWDDKGSTFMATFEDGPADAALLLLPEIGFLTADDPRFTGTLAHIEKELRRGDYVFRYTEDDDFGAPENAFNVCTFWYINALDAVGRTEEARALFENMLARCNHLGLLSEDLDPNTGELWGNFPQTYSMVGLIASAMRLSQPWDSAF